MSKDSKRKVSRRAILAAAGGLTAAGAALGQSQESLGNLMGGTMALDEAYNVSDNLWIGPDSAKGDVVAESGRLYMATDTQIDYYGDGNGWVEMGVGSSSKPVPDGHFGSLNTDEGYTETVPDDPTAIPNTDWVSQNASGGPEVVASPGDDLQTKVNDAQGGRLLLEAGDYEISEAITVPSNTTIMGTHAGAEVDGTTNPFGGSDTTERIVGSRLYTTGSNDCFVADGIQGFHIQDLGFAGFNRAINFGGNGGIAQLGHFRNLTFDSIVQAPIYVTNPLYQRWDNLFAVQCGRIARIRNNGPTIPNGTGLNAGNMLITNVFVDGADAPQHADGSGYGGAGYFVLEGSDLLNFINVNRMQWIKGQGYSGIFVDTQVRRCSFRGLDFESGQYGSWVDSGELRESYVEHQASNNGMGGGSFNGNTIVSHLSIDLDGAGSDYQNNWIKTSQTVGGDASLDPSNLVIEMGVIEWAEDSSRRANPVAGARRIWTARREPVWKDRQLRWRMASGRRDKHRWIWIDVSVDGERVATC